MRIVTGIDLIYLPRFKKSLKNGGENFLKRVFLKDELDSQQLEHLAGIFAAKEAVMKALNLPVDSWHSIQISHNSSGEPQVKLQPPIPQTSQTSLSISHNGQYVIAQFVACLPAGRHY